MKSPFLFHYIILTACMTACVSKPEVNLQKEKDSLALLQQQEEKAHQEEQPALLVNMLNDTLVQVKNGEVSYFTKDQMTDRFIKYFESVAFIKWEDIQPPVYSISDDGSMANILIRKQVVVTNQQDTSSARTTTDLAWTELWKKKEGRWKMYQVTTTDKAVE